MKTHPKAGTFDMRPRVLDTDPRYKGLSSAAKELYTVMFGRTCLSATKGDAYRDADGVFIIYTQEEAQTLLNCKKDKALNVFKELEAAGLIKRKRYGYGNPYRIYVKDLLGRLEKTTCNTAEKPSSEYPEKPDCTGPEKQDNGVDNSDGSNNKNSHTDLSNPDTTIDFSDWEKAEQQIKENIAYDILLQELPREPLERILRVMLSKGCSSQTHIRIHSADVPVQKVREELLKLNDLHIRFVCDKLMHMPTEIKSMDAVCLNLLWNASLDMEIESTAAFNRDKAAGKI